MTYEAASTLGFIGITFVMAYLAINMDEEHIIAKFIFMLGTFGGLLLTSRLAWNLMEVGGAGDQTQMVGSGLFYLLLVMSSLLFLYFGFYLLKQTWSGVAEYVNKKARFK